MSSDVTARLARLEERLEALAAALGNPVHPDDVASVRSVAEDGLVRASNAQAIAEDALARAAESDGRGVDALARADNAQVIAEDALGRAADATRLSEDAAQGAQNAVTAADSALRRLADREGKETDALARADRAQAIAEDAIERAAGAEARADDAAATATLARDVALEALMPARMAAFDAWLELCPPPHDLLLSVVLATRDRPALLGRAIASVLAQRHPTWQLVVVDDGDTGAVGDVLATVEDARIVVVEGPRRGLGAARNAGLDAVTGGVVCYLDDDNAMHPGWLRAVARVFSERGDVDVAYGVTVAEHRAPGGPPDEGWWPSFWQLPWSREALLEQNLTDAGALAHRHGLAEARFDEDGHGEDWDLLIRLTAERPALAIPAVSHAYSMAGGDHMRQEAGYREGLDEVRRRHAGK